MTEQVSIDFTTNAQSPPASHAEPRLLLTVVEAAHVLGCGRTLIYELLNAGELEAIKLHRLRRIPADSVNDYVDRLRAEQAG